MGSCRFVTTQIPTDLSIQVQDINFTVHKVSYHEEKNMAQKIPTPKPLSLSKLCLVEFSGEDEVLTNKE